MPWVAVFIVNDLFKALYFIYCKARLRFMAAAPVSKVRQDFKKNKKNKILVWVWVRFPKRTC